MNGTTDRRPPFSQVIYACRCPACGLVRFTARKPRRGFCSKRCGDGYYNAARAPRWDRSPRVCAMCRTEFGPAHVRQVYCGTECARRYTRKRGKARRRALELSIAHEVYTLAEIAARDGSRCGLCRRRVLMAEAVPHRKAPTIDHILPLAAGGDDTKRNVQLAHFECNWRKSDRVQFAQPLLFG